MLKIDAKKFSEHLEDLETLAAEDMIRKKREAEKYCEGYMAAIHDVRIGLGDRDFKAE